MGKEDYSPSSLNLYLFCPRAYLLSRVAEGEVFTGMEIGRRVHEVIARYYRLIPEHVTPGEIDGYLSAALSGQDWDELSPWLKSWRSWERKRLTKGWKVVDVEVSLEKGPFKGRLDVIFTDGRRIGVDWKLSVQRFINNAALQAAIYTFIADLDEFIIVSLGEGREYKLDKSTLEEAAKKAVSAVEGIRKGDFRSERSRCGECPFNIACKEDWSWTPWSF